MTELPKPKGMHSMRAIIEAFPRIFRGEPPSIPGWIRPGWNGTVHELMQRIDAELNDVEAAAFAIIQVKEKFGSLQIYFDAPHAVRARLMPLIVEARKAADTICDRCGKPGRMRDDQEWYAVLCDRHHANPNAPADQERG